MSYMFSLLKKNKNDKRAIADLDRVWRDMEMSCENNYKDMAHEQLFDYESMLNSYAARELITRSELSERLEKLEEKKKELKDFKH